MTKNLVKDLIERPIGASDGRETLEVVAAYLIQDLIKDPIDPGARADHSQPNAARL